LDLYYEGAHIGEYEHSIVKHVDAKREEPETAAHLLLGAYQRYGKIAVRWNGLEKIREIKAYQERKADPGRGGAVLGLIPKAYRTKR